MNKAAINIHVHVFCVDTHFQLCWFFHTFESEILCQTFTFVQFDK